MAAEARPAPSGRHSRPARERRAGRGLSLELVRLSVAQRPEPDRRPHRQPWLARRGSGGVHRSVAADRSSGRPDGGQRRSPGEAGCRHAHSDRSPAMGWSTPMP